MVYVFITSLFVASGEFLLVMATRETVDEHIRSILLTPGANRALPRARGGASCQRCRRSRRDPLTITTVGVRKGPKGARGIRSSWSPGPARSDGRPSPRPPHEDHPTAPRHPPLAPAQATSSPGRRACVRLRESRQGSRPGRVSIQHPPTGRSRASPTHRRPCARSAVVRSRRIRRPGQQRHEWCRHVREEPHGPRDQRRDALGTAERDPLRNELTDEKREVGDPGDHDAETECIGVLGQRGHLHEQLRQFLRDRRAAEGAGEHADQRDPRLDGGEKLRRVLSKLQGRERARVAIFGALLRRLTGGALPPASDVLRGRRPRSISTPWSRASRTSRKPAWRRRSTVEWVTQKKSPGPTRAPATATD